MRKALKAIPLLIWVCCAIEPVKADDAAARERGLEVAREADRRNTGWGDMRADMRMVLRNAHGSESDRDLVVKMLEVRGDGDKSLLSFLTPADVRGTTLLTHTHALQPDDQWQYFPTLRRVKRIASDNKSGPFMGSEFAYEDMTGWELEKYSYLYLREDDCGVHRCHVMEMYPQYPRSGYTRQVIWLDTEHYRPLRIVYHDRRDALLKTQEFSEYERYLERYWRAGRMTMENHQTGKSTTLYWDNYRFGNGFSDMMFERGALAQLR